STHGATGWRSSNTPTSSSPKPHTCNEAWGSPSPRTTTRNANSPTRAWRSNQPNNRPETLPDRCAISRGNRRRAVSVVDLLERLALGFEPEQPESDHPKDIPRGEVT